MASPEHHRSTAEELLAKAKGYGPSAFARLTVLAEAQIHATLYAAEITALAAAPVRMVLPDVQPVEYKGTNYVAQALAIPVEEAAKPDFTVIAAEDTTDDTPAPAPKKRTRKAPTTAKETSE